MTRRQRAHKHAQRVAHAERQDTRLTAKTFGGGGPWATADERRKARRDARRAARRAAA